MNIPPMHPAVGLLIQVVIAVHIALPLGTWLLLAGRRNESTRLWFLSISFYSLSMCAIALRPWVAEYPSTMLAWTGACASWLMMIEALRRELGFKPKPGFALILPVTVWVMVLHGLHETGHMKQVGVLIYSCAFICLNLVLSGLVWQLRRIHRSRSLLLMQLAFAIHAGAYLNRLYQYAVSGKTEYLNVFSFSWVSNLVTLSSILAMVLICFGYWGFCLERTNSETTNAQQGQRQAEAESETMRNLVRERDQLLMLNARVSSLSSLSSFSAMLVHDISQPLQALELGLYDLQNQITPSPDPRELQPRIDNLMLMSGKASEMVSSLRRLMIRGQDQMDAVNLLGSIEKVFPVLRAEAQQRGIALRLSCQLPTGCAVQANEVMLQRIVFNLVANAMDALGDTAAPTPEEPTIHIELFLRQGDGKDWVVLQIRDNGPGWPADLLKPLPGPVVSSKAQGSGLGLLLTHNMVRLWGGQTAMENDPSNPGALIALWLAPADKLAPDA